MAVINEPLLTYKIHDLLHRDFVKDAKENPDDYNPLQYNHLTNTPVKWDYRPADDDFDALQKLISNVSKNDNEINIAFDLMNDDLKVARFVMGYNMGKPDKTPKQVKSKLKSMNLQLTPEIKQMVHHKACRDSLLVLVQAAVKMIASMYERDQLYPLEVTTDIALSYGKVYQDECVRIAGIINND